MKTRRTVQKDVVSAIVFDAHDHPTAEEVYKLAKEALPSISLGTVYRILKQLVSDGAVIEHAQEGAPSRFDGNITPHAHFVCEKCGKYVDIQIDLATILSGLHCENGEQIDSVSISLKGLCADCKEN